MAALDPDQGQDSTPRSYDAEAVKERVEEARRREHQPTAEDLAEFRRLGLETVWTAPRRERRALAGKKSRRRYPPLRRLISARLRSQIIAALEPFGLKETDVGLGLSGRRISFANIPAEHHAEARRILARILGPRFLSPERRRARHAVAVAARALAARREACPPMPTRRTCPQPRSSCCSRSRAAADGGGGGAGDDDGDGDDPDVGLVSAGWRS